MSDTSTTATFNISDQTFLIGETIYLRAFLPDDGNTGSGWHPSPFAMSPERLTTWVEADLYKEEQGTIGRLAIVRKNDDVIVGSVRIDTDVVSVDVSGYIDQLYGDIGQHWLAEALILVAKWRVDEHFMANCEVAITSDQMIAIGLLEQAGFVVTVRLREMVEMNGQRVDMLTLSYLNAAWVERLGDPRLQPMPEFDATSIRPVPRSVSSLEHPPAQAMVIGPRVYLRPDDKGDVRQWVDSSRRETDASIDLGRQLRSIAGEQRYAGKAANARFPHELWFAVCLRENDELIGGVGLDKIDYVHRTAETGAFLFDGEHRGQGLGFEAKHLLLEYAFDVLGLHMVTSLVYPFNERSVAALVKQGYRLAGRHAWHYPYRGGFGDDLAFDLLASEWRALL